MKKQYNIIEVTPEKMQCAIRACPAIYETDRETYLVVGRELSQEELKDLGIENRVASYEKAVEIPEELILKFLEKQNGGRK